MVNQLVSFERNGRIAKLYELSQAITSKHVADAIIEFENSNREVNTYGHSSTYDLIVNNIAYPPKAIFGLALTNAIGFTITSDYFSGGLNTPCFRRFAELGFQISPKKENTKLDKASWSNEEFKDSVEMYLCMLSPEFIKNKSTKKHIYEKLSAKHNRSPKAYEFRMQNISYVFELLGRKWAKGLKPKQNITISQISLVEKYIAEFENKPFENLAAFEVKVKQLLDEKSAQKPDGNKQPKQATVSTVVYERNAKVKAWALNRAQGICECCNHPAPFETPDNRPFLEVHHLVRLVDGGSDTPDNCVAICPNCHRLLHFGKNKDELTNQLISRIAER
ncbi:HNH endonuclease [Vibrio coralliirubri]|uniref:HNH endonuclease n=1 Tax=Vibrio coralliirubri TaxID=1516159 RepID=UPI001FD35FE3|nr:HNH endonuclease [Vibrio coralliirubri]